MEFVPYNDKSSAKRGFGRAFKMHIDRVDAYLEKVDDKWGFYKDENGNAVDATATQGLVTPTPVDETHVEHKPEIAYVWPGDTAKLERDAEPDAVVEDYAHPEHDHFSRFALGQLTAERRADVIAPEATRAPVIAKIEKNRPEQNGVKRPSAGTTCSAVWGIAARLSEVPSGKIATLSQVVKAAEAKGINKFTARTQYARWRVFHGLIGRLS